MDSFLCYILKSTVCIGFLYMAFKILMSKEVCFSLNRGILLTVIAGSILIPMIYLPILHTPVRVEMIPDFSSNNIHIENLPVANHSDSTNGFKINGQTRNELTIQLVAILKYIYLIGSLFAFVVLMRNIISVLLLIRKSTIVKMDGYRLVLSDRDVPSFAFARSVIISRSDYEAYGSSILPHEKAHLQLNHFYDLILLELVKVFHWFNPAVYGIIRNIKEIHEFQADAYTLHSGVDVNQYQLLLIKKCVGPKKFALANSFNHCQIKKRITMMNKQKNSRAWRWKVATFLPMLALLLMAFGKRGENVSENRIVNEKENKQINSVAKISQNQQESADRVIQIKSEGNYVSNKLCTLEEIIIKGKEWQNASNEWILLLIDESIPYSRVDEVREALTNAGVYHITQSASGSGEIIYPADDVTTSAKFIGGKWDDWFRNELDQLLNDRYDSLEYTIYYGFIIEKNGKVRDGHIIRPSEYEEINAAYEKILAQIPDWKPALRIGKTVSVFRTEMWSQRIKKVKK